jgi:hypothetical protein
MQRTLLVVLGGLLVVIVSVGVLTVLACSEIGAFAVERDIPERRITAGRAESVLAAGGTDFVTDLSGDIGDAPVSGVRLGELTLSVTSTAEPAGDHDDFGFLREVRVFIEPVGADDALPRREIATLTDIPQGATTLSFDLEDVDLLPYLESGPVRFVITGSGAPPPDDITFDGHIAISAEVL